MYSKVWKLFSQRSTDVPGFGVISGLSWVIWPLGRQGLAASLWELCPQITPRPVRYNPCCLVPCCQGMKGELKNSLQNLLHSSFCLLVFDPLPLSAPGVPKKNGDRHASEICLAALSLRDACQIIDRPDMRNRTIEIRAANHA